MRIAAAQRGVLCDGHPPATEQESWFPSTQKPLSPTPREKVGSLVPSSPSGMMTVLLSTGAIPECPMDNDHLGCTPLVSGPTWSRMEVGCRGAARGVPGRRRRGTDDPSEGIAVSPERTWPAWR